LKYLDTLSKYRDTLPKYRDTLLKYRDTLLKYRDTISKNTIEISKQYRTIKTISKYRNNIEIKNRNTKGTAEKQLCHGFYLNSFNGIGQLKLGMQGFPG
jgi:hypothetical protein